jgi:hypothetical protein
VAITNIGDIDLPYDAVLAKQLQRTASEAGRGEIADKVLIYGLLSIIGKLESRIEALENPR